MPSPRSFRRSAVGASRWNTNTKSEAADMENQEGNDGIARQKREEGAEKSPFFHLSSSARPSRCRKWLIAAFLTVLVWTTACLTLFTHQLDDVLPGRKVVGEFISRVQLGKLDVPSRHDTPSTSRRLRLFMPADKANVNLCKTVMSAVALGYPMPTLLNWNGGFNRPDWHFAGSHIAKLESLLSVIEALLAETNSDDPVRDDDLVLLVDAYDIWFQLPPSVLIKRYHQLNREADERTRKQWQDLGLGYDFPILPPRQEIIVTTAKDCFPDRSSGSDPHYDHWPESPMPNDLYGPGTDEVIATIDPARKYKKIRPRCANSGMIMGTMGALRQALLRCKEKIDDVAKNGRQLWSDQALLGEVIGDQEMWREWVRSLAPTWDGDDVRAHKASMAKEINSIARAAMRGRRYEFGIGLDYNFTTIPATCSSEEDGDFVRLNDFEALADLSYKAGVPYGVRVNGIPAELRHLQDPDDMLDEVRWGNEPLYTDFFFGVTPVGIHHNAYVDGLKPYRLQNWWDKMWYYPRLRDLVTRRLQSKQGEKPLARVALPSKDGQEIVYWASREDHGRRHVRVFDPWKGKGSKFTPIEWDGVCQAPGKTKMWYDEVFGDGKGPIQA